MALKWAARRQVLYYIVAGIIAIALGAFAWQAFFTAAPSCTDNKQNGTEQGVDCGGTCAALCPNISRAPTILWARSFESSPHTYTAVAYLQNNNASAGAGAKSVHYSFRLLDANNVLVAERQGVLDIPPTVVVPVVDLNVDVGNRIPVRTFFEITDDSLSWQIPQAGTVKSLRISNVGNYSEGRLTATVVNESAEDAKKVQVMAVLFDAAGVARGASKATLTSVGRKSQEQVTFTWPTTLTGITRTEVTVLPSF